MIDNKMDLMRLAGRFFQDGEELNSTPNENQGIVAGDGGCVRDRKPDGWCGTTTGGGTGCDDGGGIVPRKPFFPPIYGGGFERPFDPPILRRDKYERDEMFEKPTGIMDQLVDIFGIDDTRVFGQNGKIVVDTGMGSDDVNVTKGENGGVTVEVNGKKYEFTAEQAKNLEIRGGSGNDNIKVADDVKTGVVIRGGSGDDTITGGGGNDSISGGSGNDTISGGAGRDWIHGGTGDDTIRGGIGNDVLLGGSGDDTISGGRGNDEISGGRGADILRGGSGDDNITRDFADREVNGGSGKNKVKNENRLLFPLRPFRPFDMNNDWKFRA